MKAKHSHKWIHKATTASVTFSPDAPTDKDGYVVGADEKKEIEYRCTKKVRPYGYIHPPVKVDVQPCNETLKVIYQDDSLTEIHFEGDVINDTKTIEVWRKAGW